MLDGVERDGEWQIREPSMDAVLQNPGTISRSNSVSITLFTTASYQVFSCPTAHAVGGPKPEAWARRTIAGSLIEHFRRYFLTR